MLNLLADNGSGVSKRTLLSIYRSSQSINRSNTATTAIANQNTMSPITQQLRFESNDCSYVHLYACNHLIYSRVCSPPSQHKHKHTTYKQMLQQTNDYLMKMKRKKKMKMRKERRESNDWFEWMIWEWVKLFWFVDVWLMADRPHCYLNWMI